ncbi:MAG: insulinase family protein [Clostridia bacterium]|nr:insulinase family protein [Clostridia bacterium]
MVIYKTFDNGLRLVINKIDGLTSVSSGVMVKTGSINESKQENGISHYIEHVNFKGTEKRTAFEISDYIDRIGAQINAFTSKEMTCYYTKSTKEHTKDSLEVLSDIFFNSTYEKTELEKEKDVVIEEINMCEDTPEDICLDLLAQSYYGENGLGQTILGSIKNIKSFNAQKIKDYLNRYYTADNVVISVAGNVDIDATIDYVKEYFESKFTVIKSDKQVVSMPSERKDLFRSKRIEQSHIGMVMKGYTATDELADAFSIANTVLGGGMSSRLFQRIREDLGLCYSVYSYPSQYKDNGILEIYAGVNTQSRDKAVEAIVEVVDKFKKDGVTEQEFARGKEQLKSSFIFSRESTGSQMLLYGRYLLFLNKEFDFEDRIKKLESVSMDDVRRAIDGSFDIHSASTATVGPKRTPIKI